MKDIVFYLLLTLSVVLWSSCTKNEQEPQPQPPLTVAVTGVTLNKTTLVLEVDVSENLTAGVAPENATNKTVTWSSSNVAVAIVDNNGSITAVAAGTTVITVITGDGGKTASCQVTVESKYVEPAYFASFKFDGQDYKIADDQTCIFTKHADNYYVVNCSDTIATQALTISIAKNLEKGKSYDIYSSSIYVMSDIKLLFTAGETIAEESVWTDDITQTLTVIGSLTVTELTDELLSGTFTCRTMHGEITEGIFHVRAREWE